MPCADARKKNGGERMRSSSSKRRGLGAFSFVRSRAASDAWKIE